MTSLRTARLRLRRLTSDDLDAFHALIVDPHIRRYLLDGEQMDRAWSANEIAVSDALFASHGVGIWLVAEIDDPNGTAIGFAGFKHFDGLHDEPELMYAFLESCTGHGLATEVGAWLVRYAREVAGFSTVVSAVDAPNTDSIHVLEKLGFERTGAVPGAFGDTLLFELSDDER